MQAPPTYAPPPKKSNTGLIIGLVIGAVAICCVLPLALFGGGLAFVMGKGQGLVGCQLAYTALTPSVLEYAQANGGRLPAGPKWNDDVRKYYATNAKKLNNPVFKIMPPEGEWSCNEGGSRTGFALNKAVAGKKLSEIANPGTTPLIFETTRTGRNLVLPYSVPPYNQSPKTMGMDERRGWFVAMVDGDIGLTDERGKFNRSGPGASLE